MLGKEGNPGKLCSFAKGQEIRGMEGVESRRAPMFDRIFDFPRLLLHSVADM